MAIALDLFRPEFGRYSRSLSFSNACAVTIGALVCVPAFAQDMNEFEPDALTAEEQAANLPIILVPPAENVQVGVAPPLLSDLHLVPAKPSLPKPIREMIETAIATNDAQSVETVVKIAKRTAPDHKDEIEGYARRFRQAQNASAAEKEAARQAMVRASGPFELWKGEIELGGSRSAGNTSSTGFYGNVKLKRIGLDWEHDIGARLDYRRTNGSVDTERGVAAYTPRYNLDPNNYVFGLAQFEHDLKLGYDQRYTLAAGLGLKPLQQPNLKIDVSVGPALRYTDFYDRDPQTRIAGRGSLSIKWQPAPKMTIKQDAAIYLQEGESTFSSETGLETPLFGSLSSRLSYNMQYESDAPEDRKSLDTVARASLLYRF